jgi:hypothetical protein
MISYEQATKLLSFDSKTGSITFKSRDRSLFKTYRAVKARIEAEKRFGFTSNHRV